MDTLSNKYKQMCRTCMNEGQNFSSIFEDSGSPLKVCEMLTSLAPQLLILSSDQLPQQLCEVCINKLNIAYEFQKMCIASEIHMRNDLIEIKSQIRKAQAYVIQTDLCPEEDPLLDELIKLQETINTEYKEDTLVELDNITHASSIKVGDEKVNEIEDQLMDTVEKTKTEFYETEVTQDLYDSQAESSSQCNTETRTFIIRKDTLVELDNITHASSTKVGDEKVNEIEDQLMDIVEKTKTEFYETEVTQDLDDSQAESSSQCNTETRTLIIPKDTLVELDNITHASSTKVGDEKVNEIEDQLMDIVEKTETEVTQDLYDSQADSSSQCNTETSIICKETKTNEIEKPLLNIPADRKLQCPHCPKTFGRPHNLRRHIQVHNEGGKFLCDICNYRFATSIERDYHKASHEKIVIEIENISRIEGYKCKECQRIFEKSYLLAAHTRTHRKTNTVQIFECDVCPKTYYKLTDLTRHRRSHPQYQNFKCTICPKTFPWKGGLTAHMNKHNGTRRFVCDICNKAFDKNHEFLGHRRTHTGEKPFKCSVCDKSFHQKRNLRVHMARHTGYKPIQCTECPSKFISASELARHMASHKTTKPYECELCQSRFTQLTSLKKHKQIHSGERPFKCDICSMTFVYPNSLRRHMHTHNGERPYKCKLCDRAYAENYDLNNHMRTHLGGKPFKCDQCPEAFKKKLDLRDHLRMHYKRQKEEQKQQQEQLEKAEEELNVEEEKQKE